MASKAAAADAVNVAVLGADSQVGQRLLEMLAEDVLPLGELVITSAKGDAAAEDSTLFKGRGIAYSPAMQLHYADYDVVLCASAEGFSPELEDLIREAGSFFIDASGASKGELAIAGLTELDQGIAHWSLPDSRAALLAPLISILEAHDLVGLDAVFLEPASMKGDAGVDELAGQAAKLLNGRPVDTAIFPAQLAFNMMAAPSDHSSLKAELAQLCGHGALPPLGTRSVQVGVFYGLGLSLGMHFSHSVVAADIESLMPGKPAKVAHAVALADGKGWMRSEVQQQSDRQLSLWMTSDDIRARAEGLINLAKLLIKNP